MTQISASLTIPAQQEELMREMLQELQALRAMMLQDTILTEEEACALLKVGKTTMKAWRKEGWLPYFSEGKSIKYEREAILQAYKARFAKVTYRDVKPLKRYA
ncbi:helix-turn-helix domain-containing protein [Runella zeae]|uniref:helix-turn-helix domain-containing protein n=1 Tax=Runella zeae TaxID=94255 RepID=UPI002353937D|nr:helix-turn-helix domain-containing protein [Runella zeae]